MHGLAVLILFHVVGIWFGALPVIVDERGMDREAWSDPLVQNEFLQWEQRLEQFGWNVSAESLEEWVWTGSGHWLAWKRTMTGGYQWYYAICGTRQRWRMFPAAVEEPVGMSVWVREDGSWKEAYGMRPGASRWMGEHLDRDRFRAALNLYAWGLHPDAYETFVDWISVEAFREFPSADEVRVGFSPVETVSFSNGNRLESSHEGKLWRVRSRELLDENQG